MNLKDNLTSSSPWERARALYRVKENHLKDPDILYLTLKLLDDDEYISIPDKIREEDQELAGLFESPSTGWSPETPEQGPRFSRVWELAEFALENQLPGTKETLAVLLKIIKEADFQCRDWLDRNFFRFSWPDPQGTFIYFVQAAIHADKFFLYHCIKQAPGEAKKWIIHYAISRKSPVHQVFSILFHEESSLILDELIKFERPVKELLPHLADLAEDTRASFIITKWAGAGMKEAYLYRSLFDPGAYEKTRSYLASSQHIDKTIVEDLITRVCKRSPYPTGFPLTGLMKRVDIDFALRHLTNKIPGETRIEILITLLENTQDSSSRYYLLQELGTLGGLKESEILEKEFFTLLRNKHCGILPPSEDNHPFISLANLDTRPPNFRKELLNFLKDNLITIILVLRAIPHFLPAKDEEEIVKKAIIKEIQRVKEGWEKDKKTRQDHPEQYYYDDRKAPHSHLMFLSEKWNRMRELAAKLGMKNTLKEIDELLAIDWVGELHALTEKPEN